MELDINKVKPGMTLDRPVFNNNGVVILNSGKVLTENIINNLIKNGINKIFIDNKDIERFNIGKDIYTTVSKELKYKSIQALRQLDVKEIIKNAEEIVNAILKSKDFSYSLLEYKDENDIYSHSVRVAAFASVLAKYYNESLLDIQDQKLRERQTVNNQSLSIAALTHDLGKTLKDSNVKISLGNVNEVFREKLPGINDVPLCEYNEKYDQLYTFCLLGQFSAINMDVRMMTLLVDENEKSTGPLKANPDLINSKQGFITASKIIRLCSIYDDLLRYSIENNLPLENISSRLEAYSLDGTLNKELTNLFIKHIPLYSVGVKVKLSDDRYATVIETFTERVNNYKPVVQIVDTGEIIDLRLETALTVKEICNDEISFNEFATRQIIDMNNGITNIEQKEGKLR